MEAIKDLIENKNIYAAIEHIHSEDNIIEVAKTYSMAVKKLYWSDKGAKNLVLIGNAGISYLLTKAKLISDSNLDEATEIRSWAKTISYDVGANTWPGWNDEGVSISVSEQYAGLQASKLNLELAISLDKPKDKISVAHWLLGAHQLAAKNYDQAINSFTSAFEISKKLDDKTSEQLNLGYIAVTKILNGSQGNEGQLALDNAILELESIGTKGSEFYIQQLKTALKVFSSN